MERDVAKAAGLTRYFTGRPCQRGHVAERLVSNSRCVECHNAATARWKKAHRKQCSAQSAKWRAQNRKRVREIKSAQYRKNPRTRERQAARARKWLEANREKSRSNTSKWREANLATAAAAQQRRRAKLLNRTPSWADHDKIRQFYVLARDLTAQTGIEHEVDHIYPLQGELVSGLHVETNLRVIQKSVNRSKGARFPLQLT